MTESGKYIAEMHKSCDEVMDSLKRMEEIVADAMNKLQSYANL